jgi:hypothetical protein
MLYKFKSKAAGDLIMLEPNGRQILQIIGKDPAPKGIILPAEMPAAVAALESAITREESEREAAAAQAPDPGTPAAKRAEGISLRQRAVPLIEMLRRCEKAGQEIVWGV